MTTTKILHLMSKKIYRLLVSGWRELPPIGFVEDKLKERYWQILSEDDAYEVEIVVGDAWGVDKVIRDWCKLNGIKHKVFYADWNGFGRAAGPIRNKEMIDYSLEADAYELFAFPHRTSIGTKDMIEQCYSVGINVTKFEIL